MKVFFYIASTINGCIATADSNSDWVSSADNASYLSACRSAGAVVMGRKTHDDHQELDLPQWPLLTGPLVVLSSRSGQTSKYPGTQFTPGGPGGAIKILQDQGLDKVVVVGGNQTWTSFARAGLVDEVFIDIEPLALGDGKFLFSGGGIFELKLKLIETNLLSSQTLQIHYQVQK